MEEKSYKIYLRERRKKEEEKCCPVRAEREESLTSSLRLDTGVYTESSIPVSNLQSYQPGCSTQCD